MWGEQPTYLLLRDSTRAAGDQSLPSYATVA